MILAVDDFLRLRQFLPVVDVRSEKEYDQGRIRGAINLPILNNEERAEVGTVYKRQGQHEAIKTGFRLVGPRMADIVEAAHNLAADGELLVHCWRGGMRSSNFCQIIGMAKIASHQLSGGYKAYRERAVAAYASPLKLHVIAGHTGSGKSEVVRALAARGEQVIDLEHLARHRGSAFGGLMMPPQPTTEQFQNELFEEIRQLDPERRIWVEDESISIGRVILPEPFWRQMLTAPVYEVFLDKSHRIERLVAEYGKADREAFLVAMQRITRKLGGQNFNAARDMLIARDMHATIDILLRYYDKAYERGLSRHADRLRDRICWDGVNVDLCVAELLQACNDQ